MAHCTMAQQDTAARVLTLDDCIKTGITNATVILKQQNNVSLTGAQLLQTYGQFLPDLNAGLGFGYNHGTNFVYLTNPTYVSSKNFGLNYQVSTTLNLFNGLADYASLKAATLNKQSAELTLERAKQLVAYDVAQAYLQVTLDKQVVDYATQNLDYSTEREKQIDDLVRVGRRAGADLLQQQAQTSQDKLFLINAQTKWQNDQVALLKKLRMDVNGKYVFAEAQADSMPLGEDYLNESQLLQTAINQRADIKALDYNRLAADWYIKKARSGYLPKLNFGYAVYGLSRHLNTLSVNGVDEYPASQRSIGTQLGNQVYGSLGLNLSWTLFDKLNTKYAITASKLYASNLSIDQEDLKIQVASDLKQAFNEYKAALQQLETTRTGLDAATLSYETQDGKYLAGAANFIDLVNAQSTLLLARQNRAQALINLSLQKKVIDLYLGK